MHTVDWWIGLQESGTGLRVGLEWGLAMAPVATKVGFYYYSDLGFLLNRRFINFFFFFFEFIGVLIDKGFVW